MFATALRSLRIIESAPTGDLPCGVYDPAQARIEAESIRPSTRRSPTATTPTASAPPSSRSSAPGWSSTTSGLWTDYFKPPHFEKFPELHSLINEATKLAGASGTKGSFDESVADELLAKIDRVAEIFAETRRPETGHEARPPRIGWPFACPAPGGARGRSAGVATT